MSKEVRNLVIAVVVALFVGYMVGGITQTGRGPLTGKIVCKDKAAACEHKQHCDKQDCNKETPAAETAPAAEATEATEAAH